MRNRWLTGALRATLPLLLPFVLAIADRGWRRALSDDPHLRNGLNTCRGLLTHPAVAHDLGLSLTAAERALTD